MLLYLEARSWVTSILIMSSRFVLSLMTVSLSLIPNPRTGAASSCEKGNYFESGVRWGKNTDVVYQHATEVRPVALGVTACFAPDARGD
jgi:hypothetical protein